MAAKSRSVEVFHDAIQFALRKLGKPESFELKEKQYELLKAVVIDGKDVIGVLPTGYGKSLIYQSLGLIFDCFKHSNSPSNVDGEPSVVVVVSPLNALMQDQVEKLKEHIQVAVVKSTDSQTALRLQRVNVVFAHPEVFVNNSHVLRSKNFQKRVCAVVVDEAHLVEEWKDFRPAYLELGVLGNYFSSVPIIGLTATATLKTRASISNCLGLFNPITITVNPDRPNIYFGVSKRAATGEDKLKDILDPMVDQLKKERNLFPLTLVYSNLETISECFSYFTEKMGSEQYDPMDAEQVAINRMFSLYHAQYPEHERQRILTGLTKGTSKLRILFVTVAFGIGVDIKDIRQVVHIGVPYTMEEYFQEAGRCGRDGLPSQALMHYNAYDISKAKKQMSNVMRDYVAEDKCKREVILRYFGYNIQKPHSPQHICCDSHAKTCDCDTCLLSDVTQITEQLQDNLGDTTGTVTDTISTDTTSKSVKHMMHKSKELHEELSAYR